MGKKILIIDDDALIQSTLKQAFELQGAEAQATGDGEAGLQMAAEWQPNVILLDHHMPGMTGIEFLKRLRATPAIAGTEVVYLTSDDNIAFVNDALSLGVKTYLNKSEAQVDDITKATLAASGAAQQ